MTAQSTALTRFPFLNREEEETLMSASRRRRVEPDEVVFEQGTLMRAIFVIERGSLRVERLDRGASIPLVTMCEGEFFGEMSFVDGEPTSARVVAEEPSDLRIIEPETISRLTTQHVDFESRLYRSLAAILAQRLRLRESRFYGDQSWG